MKKILKWLAIVIGGLIGLMILAGIAVYLITGARLNKKYDPPVEQLTISDDVDAVAQGQHLVEVYCADCHGDNLSGKTFIDEPAVAQLYTSNLTAGSGGIGGAYSDADWVRTIRHGVLPDGTAAYFMPSQIFYYLSDADLVAIIAYLKTLPPVDNVLPENRVGPLGRLLFIAGQVPLLPAEMIDHTGPRPKAPEPGVTAEYGAYLARGCHDCHGPDLTGGSIPGSPPDALPAANISSTGEPGDWSSEEFITAMRTGVTPSGRQLNPEAMPWPYVGRLTDAELTAILLYLQTQ